MKDLLNTLKRQIDVSKDNNKELEQEIQEKEQKIKDYME